MDEEISNQNNQDHLENESEDEDYVPGGENENLSEEEEDGDPENQHEGGEKCSKKRKKKTKAKVKRKRRRDSDSDSDDPNDIDFVINEKEELASNDISKDDPEVIAARESAEKERTEILWADFLSSVESLKNKRKLGNIDTEAKTVTRVYDFAGEKVTVKEKIKGNSTETPPATPGPSTKKTEVVENGTSSNTDHSTKNGVTDHSPDTKKAPYRTRISFLSGDPADIGLVVDKKMSAKEGLANVLNALHQRKKKLGTLEKSKLDWEKFKSDQNLHDELASHTKSRNGYIDKQEFLQRTDLRQFELEKMARAKRRRH